MNYREDPYSPNDYEHKTTIKQHLLRAGILVAVATSILTIERCTEQYKIVPREQDCTYIPAETPRVDKKLFYSFLTSHTLSHDIYSKGGNGYLQMKQKVKEN